MGADLYIDPKKLKIKSDEQITGLRTNIEVGYYRDAYNDSNLLWAFGLDYWVWFDKLLNKNRELIPTKARVILKTLKEKEKIFKERLSTMSADDKKWFTQHYKEFKDFLNKAIKLKANIQCSI